MNGPPLRANDRRDHPRFELLGPLWGSLETAYPLRVVNIGSGGALVGSSLPMRVDSIQRVRFSWDGVWEDVQARVIHQRQTASPAGRTFYLVGLEFLGTDVPFAESIERLMPAR